MHIVFTARDIEMPPAIQQYVEDKARKLLKYSDQIQEIRVIAAIQDKQARVEMQVDVEHVQNLVSHADSDDFRKSADLVADKLSAQLIKLKDRVQDRHRHRQPLKAASLEKTGPA